eukprot:2866638-Amphidinium_carterae.1
MEKKKVDIQQHSQTLNYVLLHATKQGSEPHSTMRRVLRLNNGFESWRQFHLHPAGGHRAQQFCFFAQSRNLHGTRAQSSSPSSTTNGLKTLE